jgi:glycosyltransferase involved in cell wall biosynthesis
MRVSLICTVLNEAATIGGLLDSIAAQTRLPDQVVIADGGSSDGTPECIRAWSRQNPSIETLVLAVPGANISVGRNRAIERTSGDVIAVTDAGVRLDPEWLATLVGPFESDDPPDAAGGFFLADPRTLFETALAATTLPAAKETRAARFLPSSRSFAMTPGAWRLAGGYPEWLDFCEDLILDLNLRELRARIAWRPTAVVHFRPRSSLRSFFLQYFRYARGDGRADLWPRRHAIRYLTYAGAIVALGRLRPGWSLPLILLGGALYLRRPYRRLLDSETRGPRLVGAAALVPWLRLIGDLAKMAGYPMGVAWRIWRRPPAWRVQQDL